MTGALTPVVEPLVDLYARLGVAGVKEDAAAIELLTAREHDNAFNTALGSVSDIAEQLEGDLEGQLPNDQVSSALGLLNSLRNEEGKQKIARELARRRYGPQWTAAQLDHFDKACRKLAWRDFFLSFTNFNPAAGEVQMVNFQHRRLIEHTLGKVYKPPANVKTNMFARVVRYYLVNNSLEGYYDPEDKEPGVALDNLEKAARSSLAFVQVVQNTMFAKWPNYCLIEWQAAVKDDDRTLIFVMSGNRQGFIKKARVDNRMHGWYEAIDEHHTVEIEPASTMAEIRAAVAELEGQVAEKVEKIRLDLIEQVPVSA